MTLKQDTLFGQWRALRAMHPRGLRIRRAAQMLDTGEAHLLASSIGAGLYDQEVVRLRPDFREIFMKFEGAGEMMVSTRNEYAVIEKHGQYHGVDIGDYVGLVLDEEIDLRFFMTHFHSVFYVEKLHRGQPLKSIQFFDGQGHSLHKVYAVDADSEELFDGLKVSFASEDQSQTVESKPVAAPREYATDEEVDIPAFQAQWQALEDTHEFHALLSRHKLDRTQALRLAPDKFTANIPDHTVLNQLLRQSACTGLSIMTFVGSPGCIEIHTGPVHKIVETGSWINVMDPRFNLHLDRSGIDQMWLVRKPTSDGIVTSLECFDAEGKVILMCFGARKPGIPELTAWRDLVEELCDVPSLHQ